MNICHLAKSLQTKGKANLENGFLLSSKMKIIA